jgi:hypothetical protein
MQETVEQMHHRLCGVIAESQFEALPRAYAWQPIRQTNHAPDDALALVRDGSSWHALMPSSPDAKGAYRIFAFHFAEGSNASGFVAWLAGLIKNEAGTGAMVICGFDARALPTLWQTSLGLFDYWGCAWDKGDDVIALVERLRKGRGISFDDASRAAARE